MYAVMYKNTVVLGPIAWNHGYIMEVMRVRYRQTIEVPPETPDAEQFPLHITEDISIYPTEEQRDHSINPMIQQYQGPKWEISGGKIIARYDTVFLPMKDAQANHRDQAAALRWDREHQIITVDIGDHEVSVSTARDQRSKWTEALQSMGEVINWKFDKVWITLTRSQVQTIAAAVHDYVQEVFDQEMRLHAVINQTQTHDELLAITELLPRKLS
jgi:hypothetical protein